jgi:hypothetical protein
MILTGENRVWSIGGMILTGENRVWSIGGMILAEEKPKYWKKNLSHCHFVCYNSQMQWPRIKPELPR